MSFAIGVTQQGILGGLLSGLLFQYPGLLLMSLTGAGAAEALANPARCVGSLRSFIQTAPHALPLARRASSLEEDVLFTPRRSVSTLDRRDDVRPTRRRSTDSTRIPSVPRSNVVVVRWLQGLTAGLAAAGVALILSAAIGLARGQCKDEVTRLLCLMSATVAFYYTSNFIFPLLIVVGGLTTLYTKRNDDVALKDTTEKIHKLGVPKLFGAILILTWITIWVVVASIKNTTEYSDGRSTKVLHWCVLLKLVPIRPRWRGERRSLRTLPGASLRPPLAFNPRPRRLSTSTDAFELHPDLRFEAFYRTGSIIFGGGQVVLPLLLDDVVQYDRVCTTSGGTLVYDVTDASVCDSYTSVESEDSWITADQFFAGLGVVQVRRVRRLSLSLSRPHDCHVILSGT